MSSGAEFELGASRLPRGCCEHFATKSLYLQEDDKGVYEDTFEVGTASFWCVLSQQSFGPDGDEVSPDGCRAPRACCTPRPDPLPDV